MSSSRPLGTKYLTPYANALEEWDDIVGEVWEEPETLVLNPHPWVKEDEIHLEQGEMVNQTMQNAFEKAHTFLTIFQPLLEIYWKNNKYDLNILVHERLKNATENLSHCIKLFQYQDHIFQVRLPSSIELGLLQIDSKHVRSKLLPTPKHMIATLE